MATLAGLSFATAGAAQANELVSASYRLVGGSTNAGSTAMTSTAPAPSYSGAGSLGQREAVGMSGSAVDLTTSRPGFWGIVVGALVSLDLDGDDIQSFLDDDDDNDGLLDTVETLTGTYSSPSDTGTDPNNPDSDGDGFLDGAEVLAGTDPNIANAAVPALSTVGKGIVVAWMAISALRRLRRNRFQED